MQMEVHVHGTAFLCKGVHPSQVDEALREWLDYLEVETIAKAHSIEREETGIRFDSKEQTLEICWTGMVGRSFQNHLKETFRVLGSLTEHASEITVTYYHDNGKEEFQQIFIGPTPETIHEIRRQCIEEDLLALLAPHFSADKVTEVTALVNRLFKEDLRNHLATEEEQTALSSNFQPHSRNRHLH
jgi:hypothetical protein